MTQWLTCNATTVTVTIMAFVKLHGSILDSSVWGESKATRLVWITMLAMADGEGTVDRGPRLTEIWDRLHKAGLDINLVGKPGQ